jgi:hypothetical protein
MALTRLDGVPSGHSFVMVCNCCGHRELAASRIDGHAARARHELRAHGVPARTGAGAWALRKARQRARDRA